MNYIVIEMQTNAGTTAQLTTVHADYAHAEQQYHTILAAAAVSEIPLHSAAMLTERGNLVKYECYDRTAPETDDN